MNPHIDAKPSEGSFPEHWIDGTDSVEPLIQVHQYAGGTWILRESILANWETPFLYLFSGKERGILIDTGASGTIPLRETLDELIGPDHPLVVAHSHSHGDHIAGDAQFHDRPNTTVVGHSPQDVAEFFEIENWPIEISQMDLGERRLDIIPIPGHEPASIAIYDALTGLLITGDTLYPGRLYVRDFQAFRSSIERLVAFTAQRQVRWVLGTHIEMTNQPGVDFDIRSLSHPSERSLELTSEHLSELHGALVDMGDEAKHERDIVKSGV
jgi:glyoxylase-like metal-dependent hydrolase (beta-lactamase superfamily II)